MTFDTALSLIALILSVGGIIFTAGILKQRVAGVEDDMKRHEEYINNIRREHQDGMQGLRDHLDRKLDAIYDRIEKLGRDRGGE